MPFEETLMLGGMRRRKFSSVLSSDELIWHRDREHRLVRVVEGRGWSLQLDSSFPVLLEEGAVEPIPAEMWHRLHVSEGATDLVVEIESVDEDAMSLAVIETLAEDRKRRKRPGNPDYYKGTRESNKQMAREINRCSEPNPPERCYDEWTADKTYNKSRKAKTEGLIHDLEAVGEVLDEALDETLSEVLDEGRKKKKKSKSLSSKTRETLKKKAEKANMPLGALTSVYRKGLAAWLTGHRQGVPQHAWAMGRVNSFIRGGPARRVDKSEWSRVQKSRK